MLGAQFRSRGLELISELAEDLPLVSANPYSLEEVILNLLNNARDAVEERVSWDRSGSPARVVVRTRLNGIGSERQVQIEIIDSGTGIDEEILPKVFDPFFTTKAPDKGTGLGLAISKSIVENFGGEMSIRSTPGEGTAVTVFLPTAKIDPDACLSTGGTGAYQGPREES